MENQSETQPRAGRGHGMILGKFLPPHRGHQWLIDFGTAYCEQLTVLVCSLDREPIPGYLRYQWVCEMCPNANCIHVNEDLPQEPSEHEAFWSIWKQVIEKNVRHPIDFVFASEDYGWELADVLGATYVPVDHARLTVPVSGRAIRGDPMKYWRYLPEPARPYFAKRVCLFGPESTGKSTLAMRLADHYDTRYVWEYARPLLDFKHGVAEPSDIDRIANGQRASEDALARQCNRLLICDTDLLTTTIWSEVLFGSCPSWLAIEAAQRSYDLTLLMDIDVPWVDDAQRTISDPAARRAFFNRCQQALESAGREYRILSGGWDDRERQATQAIDQLLGIDS